MIVIVVFLLVGRMAGAAKEVAIAWEYGVSEIVDAYVFVFKLAQWPIDILGGVLASVMIPVLARMPQDQPEEMTRFRAEMLGVALGAGLLLGAVFWVALPWLVTQPWVHLASTQAEIAWGMARYLAWIVPLDLVMRLFAAWTMAANRHVNTLTEGIPALTILAAILLSHGGSEPLIWGTLLGYLAHVMLLGLSLAWRSEITAPRFRFTSPHWQALLAGLGLMVVSQTLVSFLTLIDQFYAARLGPGALSTLSYAYRVLALILALGATAISRAMLPVLARTHVERRDLAGVAWRWAVLLFVAGCGALVLGTVAAPWIVEILFQRGQFTAENTRQVVDILRYGLIQAPFYFVSMVLSYALLSQGRQIPVVFLHLVALLVKIVLSYFLVACFGLGGLWIATAFAYLVSGVGALFFIIKIRADH